MKKLIIFTLFLFGFNSNVLFAQTENPDALSNINDSLDRIEIAITSLTSQSEDSIHKQKKSKNENDIMFKDLSFQIQELKNRITVQEMEIQNLKNTVNMLKDRSSDTITNKDPAPINNDLLMPIAPQEVILTDTESFNKAMEKFNRRDYQNASIGFAENIKNFPEGENFYSNLLYLGISMQEMGIKNNACIAFEKIINANEPIISTIKDKAEENYYFIGCDVINVM